MSRWISAEVIKTIKPMCGIFTDEGFMIDYHRVLSILENAPSINIIHCRECKYRINDDAFVSGHICLKRRANGGAFCEDDDFCSYGKVR